MNYGQRFVTLYRRQGLRWWEGGSGWGIHVYPWLIHVNVWQKPLQYCKVISLQLIKKKKKKDHPHGKEMQKGKMVVWGGLKIAEKRREVKSKEEKERYTHLNAEFQRVARRDKKAFLSDQCKEIEENNRMGKTRDLFNKIRDIKGTFHAKMGSINDRNDMAWT